MKIKITFIVTLLLLVSAVGVYVYAAYQESAKEKAAQPVPALNRVMADLRKFHKEQGRFPLTFREVQEKLWKLPRSPAFGDEGRSFTMGNYYYSLGYMDEHKVTIWAVPVGPRYKEGNSFFMVLTLTIQDYWKGPALELAQTAALSPNPTETQLAGLLMIHQETPGKPQTQPSTGKPQTQPVTGKK